MMTLCVEMHALHGVKQETIIILQSIHLQKRIKIKWCTAIPIRLVHFILINRQAIHYRSTTCQPRLERHKNE